MYKCLSPSAIGILARQSELLEIVLTHKFKGLELDIQEIIRKAQTTSVAQACRYLASAQVKIGGFELPIRWAGPPKEFEADLAEANTLLEICQTLQADRCYTTIRPTCDERPFHENFQFHVERLSRLADTLSASNMKLALNFMPAPADRTDGGFEFIHQVDPLVLLLQSIGRDNVGLMFDAWNWWVGGGDLDKVRTLRADQLLSVRLADIPTGTDLSSITAEQRVMPGEGGTIDSPALISALEDLGYDGPVALAPNPELFKGQKREAIVKQASSVLESLLNASAEKPVAASS